MPKELLHSRWPCCSQTFSIGLKKILLALKARDTLTPAHLKRTLNYHPYESQEKRLDSSKSDKLAWKNMERRERSTKAKHLATHRDLPRVNHPINDNYCVNAPVYAGRQTGAKRRAIDGYRSVIADKLGKFAH